jgi:hypothetical protein
MGNKKTATIADALKDVRPGSFVIEPPKWAATAVEIGGASLIQNAFAQKAIEEMLRKHMGINTQREKKNPRQVIENAIVRNVDGVVCMPPTAFKKAMLSASSLIKSFDRSRGKLRVSLCVVGNSVPITFERMVPRMDMVRTAGINRTPDIRFRPNFINWKARLVLKYSDSLFQVQSIVDLLGRAGSVGVGEWRPEKDGTHGTFEVLRALDAKEMAAAEAACRVELRRPEIPEWALDRDIDLDALARAIASPGGDGEEEEEVEAEEKPKRKRA